MTVILSTTGDIVSLGNSKGYCSYLADGAGMAAETWKSPNGKVTLGMGHSGFLAIWYEDEVIWKNGNTDYLYNTNEKRYYRMRDNKSTWDIKKGSASYVHKCHYDSSVNKIYGCGADGHMQIVFSISGVNQLEMTFLKSNHYKNTVWKGCKPNNKKAFDKLVLRDNGNLDMLDVAGQQIWSSGSSHDDEPSLAPNQSQGKGQCMF